MTYTTSVDPDEPVRYMHGFLRDLAAEQQSRAAPFPQPAPASIFTSQEFLKKGSTLFDMVGDFVSAAFDPTSTTTAASLNPMGPATSTVTAAGLNPFGPPALTIEEPGRSAFQPRPGGRFTTLDH